MKIKLTTEEFIKRAKNIHGDLYDLSKVEYSNMFGKVKIVCHKHGIFEKEAKSFLNGGGCSKCYNEIRGISQILSVDIFLKKAIEIHSGKYDYSLSEYVDTNTKVKIICPEHGIFEQKPNKHILGQGCKKCGIIQIGVKQSLKIKNEFTIRANKKHANKYDYSLVDYKNGKSKIKIICPEHGIFEQNPNKHLSGQGCRTCSGSMKLTTEDFLRRAEGIHEGKYDYSLINYTNHYGKIKIICQKHGEFIQGAGSHLAGIGCPNCCESKGEKQIASWLRKNKINFQRQKTFNNCKYKRQLYFDFYLSEFNICIEYDGKQHFEIVEHFGGKEDFEDRKKRDNFKNKFCKKHNIHLLRITYKDDVFNTLEKWYTQKEKIKRN